MARLCKRGAQFGYNLLVGHQNAIAVENQAVARGCKCQRSVYGAVQLRLDHGDLSLCAACLPAGVLPATPQTGAGSRCSSPATRGLQAEATPPQTQSRRSVVLDRAPPVVGPLVRSLSRRPAGDCGFLASCRIPAVLAVA